MNSFAPLLLLLSLSAAQHVRFAATARDPRLGSKLAPLPLRRSPPLATVWFEIAPAPETDDTVRDEVVEAEEAQAERVASSDSDEARKELGHLDALERGLFMSDPDDYEPPDSFIAVRGNVSERSRFRQKRISKGSKPSYDGDAEGPEVDPVQRKEEEDAFMGSLDYGQDTDGVSTLTAPADVSSSYVDTGYTDEMMERADATRRRSLLAVGGGGPLMEPLGDQDAHEMPSREELLQMAEEGRTADTLASEMISLVKRADAAVDKSARLLAHHDRDRGDPTLKLRPFQPSELDQPVAHAADDPRPLAMIMGEAQQEQAEKKAAVERARARETPLDAANRAHEEKLIAETTAESDRIRRTLDALDEKMRWDDAAEEADTANLQAEIAARHSSIPSVPAQDPAALLH